MYSKFPNYILGFHGCHKDVFEDVLNPYETVELKPSTNDYDWLGHGIYFWEYGLDRAQRWALDRYGQDGRVLGAVLDLGYCLNLSDTKSTKLLNLGATGLRAICNLGGYKMPTNHLTNKDGDVIKRELDCFIIETVHALNEEILGGQLLTQFEVFSLKALLSVKVRKYTQKRMCKLQYAIQTA